MLTRLVQTAVGRVSNPSGRAWKAVLPVISFVAAAMTRPARWKRAPRIVLALAVMLVAASVAMAEPATPPEHGNQAGHHESSEHGGSGVNPLEFKKDLAIWTLVVFLLLLLVLGKYAWGPIVQGLEKREKRIEEQIASAEQANVEARRILTEYQAKLSNAEAEVREVLEKGRRDAEQLGRQMLDQTRDESRREKERALHEIDAATGEALNELARRSADLAVELAGKIVQAKMDRAEHAKLIEQAVAGFAKTPAGKN
jgi:F-type H+-transporting ATPase subunit b